MSDADLVTSVRFRQTSSSHNQKQNQIRPVKESYFFGESKENFEDDEMILSYVD
jgi:hypothetical protein